MKTLLNVFIASILIVITMLTLMLFGTTGQLEYLILTPFGILALILHLQEKTN
tara:strand:+ start:405 stop:563 length:159 start_codon:yes stop_codon:yes gene_type:complete